MPSSVPENYPEQIGDYKLLELLGEGGQGAVFRARHVDARLAKRDGGDVALKLLYPRLAKYEEALKRFKDEYYTGFDLTVKGSHPSITKMYHWIDADPYFALVMELVDGRTLQSEIDEHRGAITWEQRTAKVSAQHIIKQLCDGIGHAHKQQVIHRDIKPLNIIITEDGSVRILDFGIAKQMDIRGYTQDGTMGDPDYMAPEQFTDPKSVRETADIYALGMTIYYMLTRRLPWDENESDYNVKTRKIRGDIPSPTTLYADIPPYVEKAIMQALNPKPEQRFQSTEAFYKALTTPEVVVQIDDEGESEGEGEGDIELELWPDERPPSSQAMSGFEKAVLGCTGSIALTAVLALVVAEISLSDKAEPPPPTEQSSIREPPTPASSKPKSVPTPEDSVEMRVLTYRTGCNQGRLNDCIDLATWFETGTIPKEKTKIVPDASQAEQLYNAAFELAKERCSKASPTSCYWEAHLMYEGKGTPKDEAVGERRLERACYAFKSARACLDYGKLYQTEDLDIAQDAYLVGAGLADQLPYSDECRKAHDRLAGESG